MSCSLKSFLIASSRSETVPSTCTSSPREKLYREASSCVAPKIIVISILASLFFGYSEIRLLFVIAGDPAKSTPFVRSPKWRVRFEAA